MRLALLVLLLVAPVALAQNPAPAPKAPAGWKGQRVMSKSGFVRLHKLVRVDDDGEPVYEAAIGYEFDYIVREENGDQILLRLRDKKEGWVEKESLVLMKEASEFFTKALDADPDNAVLYRQLAAHARQSTGDLPGAIADATETIRLEPDSAESLHYRGWLYSQKKEFDKALADFNAALELKPDSPDFLCSRSYVKGAKKDHAGATADLESALKHAPEHATANNDLAWLLATCPDGAFRDGRRTVVLAEKAVEISKRQNGNYLDTLAAAYAEVQRFDDAVRLQQEALGDRDFLLRAGNGANERMELYRQRKAYREK